MDNIHVNVKRDVLEDTKFLHPDASWLVFAYEPRGEGKMFQAEIHHPTHSGLASASICLSYETVDAYIYGLQDIKQRLELLRIKNEAKPS
jgi:hypothetical protein